MGPETGFLFIFSSLVHQFSLKLHPVIACNKTQHLIEVKPTRIFLGTKFGQKQAKIGPRTMFLFIVFFSKKNEYNDSLQQCSRSSRGKTHKIFFQEPNLGQNRRKTGPTLVFCHSLKFGSLVFLQIAQDESFEDCITTRRGKTRQKKFEGPHFG